ncbi:MULTISPECIES: signal peptidase I [Ralstonia]|jgi:signal peptidase I|uniref:Signal peptidase I n=1 Tax=Ralstonia mojiangensis TaxID=2953895 RepID=A0AAE3LCU3_9RALS|nr:signal peptidase I [Ralstonia mojiangensis]MCO5412953.1 signal peptidase I [Ralstonia mojiangensis]MCT7297231.1 signal peptidase I [Ralstonia mojiangensis]MCT7309792.1 signal peptidase I [Ralstonia mojiangensis]MCT7316847.1 signal peptidase I [Ralstonia mojiangensis]MCT7327967.1 signal peptidase I [Ralstonia mojiangensis]
MNFALILFVLVVLTGIAWVADKLVFQRQRQTAAAAALAEFDARAQVQAQYGGGGDIGAARLQLAEDKLRQPWWLEYTASFFPVIAAVFLLRSFVIEPFKIPSGSMIPTLQIGDFILVNKYTYGIRLPIVNKKIVELNQPQRGDVMVFRYPKDESMDYIKRVIGVPGDVVKYDNKRLTVNGQPATYAPQSDYLDGERLTYSKQYQETLGNVTHNILNDADRPAYVSGPDDFPFRENCTYNQTGFTCKVPAGHYFMMGDNRDNSADSRYWGFVPDKNIVGKAFFIWMNLGDLKRIGAFH